MMYSILISSIPMPLLLYFRKWIGLNSNRRHIQGRFCIEPCVIIRNFVVQDNENIDEFTFVWVMSPTDTRRSDKPFGQVFWYKEL
jgi:hypothetical protein